MCSLSLSSLPSPSGLEIAEALQKLANAFGIGAGNGEAAKEAMAQLTAAYQADNPEFLLEGAGQVAVEEVVSEEVVTDEPMVVIETEDASTTTMTAMGTNEGAPSISDAITITMTDTHPITSTITTSVTDNGQSCVKFFGFFCVWQLRTRKCVQHDTGSFIMVGHAHVVI